ncbi:hypothetical protein E4M02_06340 [Brevundimonas sp. S30B]|uniref:hypothetical protein n=1 Tax=unclassified Brevundimonas TaxID=2622653 RepID=UPI001072DE95|nr:MULTISPECIES: hypothetical protein [unclassified Brevundimonas]QBX38031.1 hypothetical protein E4M01_09800 [Brevundimonas sp. MF30-B]TFW02615.1 hypothetical protein E4M02_06340 [Brevundimonas sp. S30B]
MKNYHTGVRVARCLHQAEHSLDQAILDANALVQAMIEARRAEKLAAEVGQQALADAVSGLAALAAARGDMVSSHSALARVAAHEQIGWRMDGPLEKKLEPTGFLNQVEFRRAG